MSIEKKGKRKFEKTHMCRLQNKKEKTRASNWPHQLTFCLVYLFVSILTYKGKYIIIITVVVAV